MNTVRRLVIAASASATVLAAAPVVLAQTPPPATTTTTTAPQPGVPANGQPANTAPTITPEPAPDARPSFDETLGTVLARPGGITADRVAERAAATSFDVRARHQDVVAAAAALDQALVSYFPRLTLTARYTRLSPITPPSLGNIVVAPTVTSTDMNGTPVPPGSPLISVPLSFPVLLDQAIFQASLNVPLSDYLFRTAQAFSAASHSRRAAELTERAAGAMASFNARVAWWNLVRARLSAVVADQAVVQAREHLEDVRHLEAAGAVSEADVVRVESQVANAELLALRAHDLATVTEDQVRTAMHEPSEAPLEIGDDVRAEEPALRAEGDFAALYDEALGHRPELLALAENVGSLRRQAEIARAAGYPRIDAFGDLLSANPNPRVFPPTAVFTTTWDVGVGLSWSPNDLGAALAAAHGTEARAAQVEAQRNALRDQVRSEVMGAFTAVREAEASIHTTASGLASAEESYRVRHVLFRNGRATSVELTDAETDLTRARLESLNARVDLRIARTRLEHAVGRDAPR